MNIKHYSKQFTLAMLLAMLAMLLSGCGATLPTVADGANVMRNRIDQQSEGKIWLSNFQEGIGSRSYEFDGSKFYNLAFRAEIQFSENCKWLPQTSGKQIGFTTQPQTGSSGAAWEYAANQKISRLNVQKGQKAQLAGEITFYRFRNSWYTGELNLEKAELLNAAPAAPVVKR